MKNTSVLFGNKFIKRCVFGGSPFYIIQELPSTGNYVNVIVCCIMNILVGFSTVSLNLLTVLAYWKSSFLQKKPSYFLVMVLSINDLCVGGLCNSILSIYLILVVFLINTCDSSVFVSSVITVFGSISFNTMFVLNFERYLCIVHPLFHRKTVTKRKLILLCATLWLITFITTAGLLFIGKRSLSIKLSSTTIGCSILILVFFNVRIFLASISRRRIGNSASSNTKMGAKNVKSSKVCAIVVGVTILCYLPVAVCSYLDFTTIASFMWLYWSTALGLLCSTINSIIFFWGNAILRNEAKRILWKT